jgi:pentose-5-phosphate-3-epimerase
MAPPGVYYFLIMSVEPGNPGKRFHFNIQYFSVNLKRNTPVCNSLPVEITDI